MTQLLAATAAVIALIASARTVDPAARSDPPAAAPAASPARTPAPSPPSAGRAGSSVGAGRVAAAYALAARNASAATRLASWRQQRSLATGQHRLELDRARPGRTELEALDRERASSIAILAAPPRAQVTGGRARVEVELHERTAVAGHAATTRTRNQVMLRRRARGWRVTGWTILPGATR